MLAYLGRRLSMGVIVMLGAALLSFTVLYLAPGNPAEAIIRRETAQDPSVEQIELFLETHGLDNSFFIRSAQWFYLLLQGNLGTSLRTKEPVSREFGDRFPATLQLAGASIFVAILIAIPAGILSAVRRNSLLDWGARFLALLGLAIPNFWLGLLLILGFCVNLRWLPCFGYGGLEYLLLPALTLGTGLTAILMRLQRASMLEVLNENYIRTARAKGLKERLVIGKHALKNALIPVVTIIGIQFGHLLAGTVIVESVFAWPGVGRFFVEAIYAKDYPVILGFMLVFALFFVVSSLIVDVLYAYLDPRIRYGAKR